MYPKNYFQDRICDDIRYIPIKPPENNELFKDRLVDWKVLRKHYFMQGKITPFQAETLISQCTQILKKEPNICVLKEKAIVVGDIHGQYYDLLKLIQIGGDPSENNYLFLGDYVDRGPFAVEVILLLTAIKINFPSKVVMLRGNHESRTMTINFDFRKQVLYYYDEKIYNLLMLMFDCLPLGCVVDDFIMMHGGISPEMTIDKINSINRFNEPPKKGLFCDILWSDPIDDKFEVEPKNKIEINKPTNTEDFVLNDNRGCSFYYGRKVTRQFLESQKFYTLIRAHEVQFEGYKFNQFYMQDKTTVFPQVITVFSAPNYCGYYGNFGAILRIEDKKIKLDKYSHTSHPYVLPNVLDLFDWSIPFLIENITTVMKIMLGGSETKFTRNETRKFKNFVQDNKENEQKTRVIKIKVRALGRLSRYFTTIKKNYLVIGDEKVKNIIGNVYEQFEDNKFTALKRSDLRSEKIPYNRIDSKEHKEIEKSINQIEDKEM